MYKAILAVCLSTLSLTVASKETNLQVRAGLWKITTSSDLLEFSQHIPKAQLEDIAQLAKKYGLAMPKLQNGQAITTTCITKEMAQQQTLPVLYQEELGCKTLQNARHGNRYKTSFSCQSSQLTGHGTAEGNIISPTSFRGKSKFEGSAQGIPVNEQAVFSGKWLSASCENT